MSEELKPWRCEFQYGPDGEATYAWVWDEKGNMVGTFKLVHALAIVNAANTSNTLIEEQAARIEELEQKLTATSLEALAISDTNNELQARLSEAVKVLEWYGEQSRLCRLIHSEGDAGRSALSEDGGKKAKAFITTLGENKNDQ